MNSTPTPSNTKSNKERAQEFREPCLAIRLHRGLAVGILLVITAAIYANGLQGDFIFDDEYAVKKMPCVRGLEHIPSMFFGKTWCGYRPVRYASLAIDYAIYGENPLGFHVTNVILHALVVLLVFVVGQRLLGNRLLAMIAALLYAVHPVHPDSVTYISGRRDVLCGLFFMAGFASYVRFVHTNHKRWLLSVACCYMLALLTKEMAVTLPAMLVMYDVYWALVGDKEHADLSWKQRLWLLAKQRWWIYAPVFAAAAGFIVYRGFLRAATHMRHEIFWGGNPLNNFLTLFVLHLRYYELIVAPIRLLGDYSVYAVKPILSIGDPRWMLGLVVTAGIVVFAVKIRRSHPLACFGIAWFYVAMLPVSHFIPHHELMAEHYLYIPLVGLALAASDLARGLLGHPRFWRLTLAGLGCWLIFCSVRVVIRNADYEDNQSFFSRALYWSPHILRARMQLGILDYNQGNFEEAGKIFKKLLERAMEGGQLQRVLLKRCAEVASKKGEHEEALVYLRRLERKKPNSAWTLRQMGIALGSLRRFQEALDVLQRAKSIDSDDVLIDTNMSVALIRLRRQREACRLLKQASMRYPDNDMVKSLFRPCSQIAGW